MPIMVRFDKNGFYHPAYGRMGRGKEANTIYKLPDQFAERETIEVEIFDRSSKPARVVGTKSINRYKHLPETVEIIDEVRLAEEIEEAEIEGIKPPRPKTPKPADPDALAVVIGKGREAKPQGAVERTTGQAPKRRRAQRSRRADSAA